MINTSEFQYKLLTEANGKIISLLSNTVYGSTGIRYAHQNVEERVKDLVEPHFHTLWKEEKLVAVAAYCNRKIIVSSKDVSTIYIRYFSVDSKFQGRGLGNYLTQCLADYYESIVASSTISYAYIEQKNIRSLSVSKRFDQKEVGQFKTIYFSRFYPKQNANVFKANQEDIEQLFKHHTLKYVFFNSAKLNYKKGYRVYKVNGIVVAGIQANRVDWSIHNLPGVMGWLTQNIFHYLPIIGRLSPRNSFSFVGYEGVFIKEGYEKEFLQLLEHCLNEHKVYSAVLQLDVRDELYSAISKFKKLGLMSKIQKSHPVSILVNYRKTTKEIEKEIESKPKYISVFDLT